jgi:hypothetical protein
MPHVNQFLVAVMRLDDILSGGITPITAKYLPNNTAGKTCGTKFGKKLVKRDVSSFPIKTRYTSYFCGPKMTGVQPASTA